MSAECAYRIGVDVGSTTVKLVVLDCAGEVVFSVYRRHHSDIRATIMGIVDEALAATGDVEATITITGSGGLLLANWLDVPFVQEVIANKTAVERIIPATDVAIELGGEDAKIVYFDGGVEQRMNGTCAGGTGAFIDQMATLLDTDAAGLDEMASRHTIIYPIASRCGVFAKTDVQPLLNEGANRDDIAASIFQAVVMQTISGLACGRPIRGNVAFLGGPLHYLGELRQRFIETLHLTPETTIIPEESHLFVARGAALASEKNDATVTLAELKERMQRLGSMQGSEVERLDPLFASEEDYEAFRERHARATVPRGDLAEYRGTAYLGIDAGSTTLKSVLIGEGGEILWDYYANNKGDVLGATRKMLGQLEDALGSSACGTAPTCDSAPTCDTAPACDSAPTCDSPSACDSPLPVSEIGLCSSDELDEQSPISDTRKEEPRIAIGHVTVTGYGEALLLEAIQADSGEIETVAHLRGARELEPDVDFILDIGGQDMKCMRVRDGVIEHIMLNEACSAGCGSFIEAFASSLGMTIEEFAAEALKAEAPVDLGSRCTVFMNSRVKQAQKEGATPADISAGLSYSVIKNALFKVIKLRDASELGEHAVVQGGTFLNDAVLRAFEELAGHDAVRPDIAGNMGAWGAALLARDRAAEQRDEQSGISGTGRGEAQAGGESGAGGELWAGSAPKSRMLTCAQIDALDISQKTARCGRCENNCLLTINDFGRDPETGRRRRFITGNRCEKGAGGTRDKDAPKVPNLVEEKNELLFDRPVLSKDEATRGSVGLPRALNMFENYPFWHRFFTDLGYHIELSEPSTKSTFEAGIESMPSENVCYPAKLSHGHIMDLLGRDVDFIWMPCIRWERQEDAGANNHYNCPIVMSYSEALKLNVDELATSKTRFVNPFIPYDDAEALSLRLWQHLSEQAAIDGVDAPTRKEVDAAVESAWEADMEFKQAMRAKGERTLRWLEETGGHGIVLAGRPYHADSEINHAIPELITSFGMAVLTEDSVAHLGKLERNLRVYDQWMYHTRLYNAAKVVTGRYDLDLVQLNSFGCGLDALTTDEVQEILEGSGKIYTVLKIDEVSNLGSVRIRMRSLLAALRQQGEERSGASESGGLVESGGAGGAAAGESGGAAAGELDEQNAISGTSFEGECASCRPAASTEFPRVEYTREMQESGEYTILAPQMSPIHFELLMPVFQNFGYNLELLPSVDPAAVDAGLKYVNNDICYPSILVSGQIMEAATSGRYDMDKTAFIITQTGGGCRATNYISLIRKGLHEAGLDHVPVISLSFNDTGERNSGFKVTVPMLKAAIPALLFGDLLMMLLYRVRPYETVEGSANALFRKWMDWLCEHVCELPLRHIRRVARDMIADFDALPCTDFGSKPRVGVVGEILVKFHPTANNQLVETIEREGCEAVVPGLVDFFLFAMINPAYRHKILSPNLKKYVGSMAAVKAVEWLRDPVRDELEKSERFEAFGYIEETAEGAGEILSLCNTMGEGWLLTGEMVELVKEGAPNIVCTQPFACLPNHVVGKAVIKEMRRRYPQSNIVAVDYDPGASEVNQLNRIKLMIAVAFANQEG